VARRRHDPLDRVTHLAGAVLPLLTLPQAWAVWAEGRVEGVSLTTWAAYLVVSLLFVVYGARHRSSLLLVTYIPFVVVEVAIVAGLLAR
jgi:uncharacterized protein with PQ loop repeat